MIDMREVDEVKWYVPMMIYSALDLSQYIIIQCSKSGRPVTNLKLNKILYFIQKEFLSNKRRAIFNNKIEAWQDGPVVPDVYKKYKCYKSNPINIFVKSPKIMVEDKMIIDGIIERFKGWSDYKLSIYSQAETAWIKHYQIRDNKTIPLNDIVDRR